VGRLPQARDPAGVSDDRVHELTPAYSTKTVLAAALTSPPAEGDMVALAKFPGGGPLYLRVLLRGSTASDRLLSGARYWGRRGTVAYDLGPVNNGVDATVSNVRGVSDDLGLVAGPFDFLGVSGTLAGDSLVIEVLPLGLAGE
jgi:hypothetical protein